MTTSTSSRRWVRSASVPGWGPESPTPVPQLVIKGLQTSGIHLRPQQLILKSMQALAAHYTQVNCTLKNRKLEAGEENELAALPVQEIGQHIFLLGLVVMAVILLTHSHGVTVVGRTPGSVALSACEHPT